MDAVANKRKRLLSRVSRSSFLFPVFSIYEISPTNIMSIILTVAAAAARTNITVNINDQKLAGVCLGIVSIFRGWSQDMQESVHAESERSNGDRGEGGILILRWCKGKKIECLCWKVLTSLFAKKWNGLVCLSMGRLSQVFGGVGPSDNFKKKLGTHYYIIF